MIYCFFFHIFPNFLLFFFLLLRIRERQLERELGLPLWIKFLFSAVPSRFYSSFRGWGFRAGRISSARHEHPSSLWIEGIHIQQEGERGLLLEIPWLLLSLVPFVRMAAELGPSAGTVWEFKISLTYCNRYLLLGGGLHPDEFSSLVSTSSSTSFPNITCNGAAIASICIGSAMFPSIVPEKTRDSSFSSSPLHEKSYPIWALLKLDLNQNRPNIKW